MATRRVVSANRDFLKKTSFKKLEKVNRTLYENDKERVVCLVSKEYKKKQYWFGLSEESKKILSKKDKRNYVVLGCGVPENNIIIPFSDLSPHLKKMSKTKINQKQWQIKLFYDKDHAFLMFNKNEMYNISKFA